MNLLESLQNSQKTSTKLIKDQNVKYNLNHFYFRALCIFLLPLFCLAKLSCYLPKSPVGLNITLLSKSICLIVSKKLSAYS